MRLRTNLICIAILLAFSHTPTAAAQEVDSAAWANDLVNSAIKLGNLRAADSPPFRLKARVRVLSGPKEPMDGTYTLIWVSPEKWREEIAFPGYSRLRVGDKGRYWQLRNLAFEPLFVEKLAKTVAYASELAAMGKLILKHKPKEKMRKKDGREWKCIQVSESKFLNSESCFDSAQRNLASSAASAPFGRETVEYSDLQPLGTKLFPRSMRRTDEWGESVQVTVDELGPYVGQDEGLFQPPQDSQSWLTCDDPAGGAPIEKQRPPISQLLRLASGRSIYTEAFVVLATDGTVRNAHVIRPVNPQADEVFLSFVRQVRYQPKVCNGIPIDWETSYILYLGP